MFSFSVYWCAYPRFFPSDFIPLALDQKLMLNYIYLFTAKCFHNIISLQMFNWCAYVVSLLKMLSELLSSTYLLDTWEVALLWKTEPCAYAAWCISLGRWRKCPWWDLWHHFPQNCLQAEHRASVWMGSHERAGYTNVSKEVVVTKLLKKIII